jgi:hypothetical protein
VARGGLLPAAADHPHFRLDRIQDLELRPEVFTVRPDLLQQHWATEHTRRSCERVVLRFQLAAMLPALAQHLHDTKHQYGWAHEQRLPDGQLEMTLFIGELPYLATWLLPYAEALTRRPWLPRCGRWPSGRPIFSANPTTFLAPTKAILGSWPQEAQKFGLAHLLDYIDFTTYSSLGKALAADTYQKLYLDECHALKDSHEPGLKAHVARKRSILGLTGTPPAQANSEKGRLVATYCPLVVDYTTDEAVLAGLLNDYHLVVHQLPLRTVRDYVLTTKSGSQFTTSERENYAYWSKRLAGAAQDPLPVETLRILRMQALMNYPGKGYYMRYLASQQVEKVLLFTCTSGCSGRIPTSSRCGTTSTATC